MCLESKGVLIYAGYDINELAGKASYEEIVYLLWHGALPNRPQLDELKAQLSGERELPQGSCGFYQVRSDTIANPMDVMRTAVSMLGLYDSGLAKKPGAKMRTTAAPSASPPRSG